MEMHLTQEDIIRLQFRLTNDKGIERMQVHLDCCEQCQQRQARLQAKFAQLNLIKGQTTLSDDLVRSVLEICRGSTHRVGKIPIWRLSIAASIVLGAAIFWWARTSISEQGGAGSGAQQSGIRALIAGRSEREPDRPALFGSTLSPKDEQPNRIGSEAPPFAPASAIELVVLPKREDVQITIYNKADLTLVREKRRLVLKRGWNWLQFMWANTHIDPTSLHLESQTHADQIRIEQLVFPPGLKDIGRWLVHSDIEGNVSFEMSYFASGVSWRAFYMGTLSRDEQTLSLQGYVRIENRSGEDFQNAQTRLVVGEVHLLDEILALSQRTHPFGSPLPKGLEARAAGLGLQEGLGEKQGEVRELLTDLSLRDKDAPLRAKTIAKQGLSEYFLYTIPGTETIPDQWGKRLLSLTVEDVNTVSLYRYDASRYGKHPIRFVRFANDRTHHLGQTPIPGGDVKIYQRQANSALAFVGSTAMKYVPVNEEAELNLGPARLVRVKPILMKVEHVNYQFNKDRNVTGWDERHTWRVDIDNARSGPATCEIIRDFGTPYWRIRVHDPDLIFEKHDATRVRFCLTVPAQTQRSLHYTVTTFHGTREQQVGDTPDNAAPVQPSAVNR